MTLLDALTLAAQHAARTGVRFFVTNDFRVLAYRPGNCKIVAVVLPADAA